MAEVGAVAMAMGLITVAEVFGGAGKDGTAEVADLIGQMAAGIMPRVDLAQGWAFLAAAGFP